MTELGFLIELLTEHKLPKATKQRITERMKEVESGLARGIHIPPGVVPRPMVLPPGGAAQAPSTLAAMARHQQEDPMTLMGKEVVEIAREMAEPRTVPIIPQDQVAQTVATAMALQQRQQIINDAINGQVAVKETGKMTTKAARKW